MSIVSSPKPFAGSPRLAAQVAAPALDALPLQRKRDKCMRFFVLHWAAFKRINFIASALFLLAVLGAFVAPYVTGDRSWHVQMTTFWWIGAVWLAIESVVLMFSIYVARRFVFVSDQVPSHC